MAYSTGPYTRFVQLPVPARPTINSARNIDVTTGRYTLDNTTGGFEAMPPTVQRVIILASRAMLETKVSYNSIEMRNKLRLELNTALSVLTAKPDPAIRLDELLVMSEVAGTANVEIAFKDLTVDTGIDQRVQLA